MAEGVGARFGREAGLGSGLLRETRGGGLSALVWPFARAGLSFHVFPYRRGVRFEGLKFRARVPVAVREVSGAPRFLNTGGAIGSPYMADEGMGADVSALLICEGETDTLTALGRGFAAIGVPGWGGFKAEWVEGLRGKAVFLAMDGDAAGARGAEDARRKFEAAGHDRVWRIRLPAGSDLNDHFRAPDGSRMARLLRGMASRGWNVGGRWVKAKPRIGDRTGRILYDAEAGSGFPEWPDDPRLGDLRASREGFGFVAGTYEDLTTRVLARLLEREGGFRVRAGFGAEGEARARRLLDGEAEAGALASESRGAERRFWRDVGRLIDRLGERSGAGFAPRTLSGRRLAWGASERGSPVRARGLAALERIARGTAADVVNRAAVWLEDSLATPASVSLVWFESIRVETADWDEGALDRLRERMEGSALAEGLEARVRLDRSPGGQGGV